ncbi:ERCC4 domain-containing protein [Lachnoclostridium phytofermentans]|uniref:ERCC4 domain-containing protein n=1 Tax=Lachnoclostridium phytofermentans TaxID=66219 RepID=UPI0004982476|nr:ERCC4 domain-containing protein [Lachnoclostridium phytofermentans]
MTIQVDSREKARAIKKILATFDSEGVKYYISKLWTGDYMSLDNPRLIIDRKQNISEICNNVTQDHTRFRNELIRAQENGIKLVILCEHGNGINSLQDLVFWVNPRAKKRVRIDGKWTDIDVKAMKGDVLYKILNTLQDKYGCEFLFCDKKDTGKRILEILGGCYDT